MIEDDDLSPEPLPPDLLAEIEARVKVINKQLLIQEHGEEKAAEILLNRELGELTYDLDATDE